MKPLKNSDICLSVRFLKEDHPPVFSNLARGSLSQALELQRQLRPTRLEWSYVSQRNHIAQFKELTPVFVGALNTMDGHALSFDGEPIVAPWMKHFGSPTHRFLYICQNNPDDLQNKVELAQGLIRDGVCNFHFDDWYGNAQMFGFKNPCFCEYCMKAFALDIGLEFNYRDYLSKRGFRDREALMLAVEQDAVPLWREYQQFQRHSVVRFFSRLKESMNRAYPEGVTLSVNAVASTEEIRLLPNHRAFDYLNGELHQLEPENIAKAAQAAQGLGKLQVVTIWPDQVPERDYHLALWVHKARQAIGLCYCLGLVPVFPYDVFAGNEWPSGKPKARWFGTWEEFKEPYEIVRKHPEWFDDYQFENISTTKDGTAQILSKPREGKSGAPLLHTIGPDGEWKTV